MAGYFITFEGIEGSGKSTQIARLAETLRADGREVVLTREPGGTRIGEKVRAILLDCDHDHMVPTAELLLYAAARAQHVAEVIRPALAEGKIALCDRYADATTAYQGAARAIDASTLGDLHRIATDDLVPNCTVLLDLDPAAGLARNVEAGKHDRFEREALAFHERVREGYLAIARAEPERVVVVAADRDPDVIAEEIAAVVEERIT